MARPITVLVGVKASEVKKMLKDSTLAQVAAHFGCTVPTLYNRFGDDIRGISPRGRRAGAVVAKKAPAKKTAKPAAKKTAKKAAPKIKKVKAVVETTATESF